jgi:hypothetical protein
MRFTRSAGKKVEEEACGELEALDTDGVTQPALVRGLQVATDPQGPSAGVHILLKNKYYEATLRLTLLDTDTGPEDSVRNIEGLIVMFDGRHHDQAPYLSQW